MKIVAEIQGQIRSSSWKKFKAAAQTSESFQQINRIPGGQRMLSQARDRGHHWKLNLVARMDVLEETARMSDGLSRGRQ